MSVTEWKELGNQAFRNQDFVKAKKHYTRALLQLHHPIPATSSALFSPKESAVLHSNRSAANFKLGGTHFAFADAWRCIELDPSFLKGFFRAGQALETLGLLMSACVCYSLSGEEKMVSALEPRLSESKVSD